MVRYLFYMSYIGTRYRGAAKQLGCERLLDIDSIEGAIEIGLKTGIYPRTRIKPIVSISSRTDAGVHALCNTAQVELEHPIDVFYDPIFLQKKLNLWFARCGHEIRITTIYPITEEFDPRRSALSRSYFYRIGIAKNFDEHRMPIAELGRSWHVRGENIDIEAMRQATRLFMGRKNFATFAAKNRTNREIRFVRSLDTLTVEPAIPLMPYDPLSENFNFWHINIKSRGFLYNQVRRIVGALVGLASGVINEKDITTMLHVPCHYNYDSRINPAPPQGLYLKTIEYDEEQLNSCIIKSQNLGEAPKSFSALQ